jgi:hypothetical protein
MKILWIKPVKLVPVDIDGKIRSYNIWRKLAGRSEEVPAGKSPKIDLAHYLNLELRRHSPLQIKF